MDTKWKLLKDNERINYGISQADMYQMYAYAKKYNAKKVIVIYPLNESMKKYNDNGIEFYSDNIRVKILFFDLIDDHESIIKLISVIKNEV